MAEIKKITSLKEISFSDLKKEDLVLFDLDDTVFIQEQKIMRNVNSAKRKNFIEELRKDYGNEKVSYVFDNTKYILVENKIKDIKTNATILGLTVRRTGKATLDQKLTVEDDTIRILNYLGVKLFDEKYDCFFKNMNPTKCKKYVYDSLLLSFKKEDDAMVKKGIIFTNNLKKGFVLKNFLEKKKLFPSSIIFIDDKYDNLLSVKTEIENEKLFKNISLHLYHYTKASLLDNTVNDDILSIQKKNIIDEKGFPSDSEVQFSQDAKILDSAINNLR